MVAAPISTCQATGHEHTDLGDTSDAVADFTSAIAIKPSDGDAYVHRGLLTQQAHLQKILGKKLEGDPRRAARADFIRQRLSAN